MSELNNEEQKVALVTGAGRGIGSRVAVRLARDGFLVAINFARSKDGAEATLKEIEAAGGSGLLVPFDVRNAGETSDALGKLSEKYPVSILVNNAGICRDAAFPSMSEAQWSDVISTSLSGFYNVTQPLVMPMVQRRYGRIVSLSSVAGILGNRGQVNYAAAKAGLIGATKALALEVAKRGVTVNAVAPGLIDTEMIQGAPLAELIKNIPMKRLGTADEVAAVVSFLCSSEAGYITGQTITVGGGLG